MERELWRSIVWGLKRLPRWSPRNAVYDNREVLAVLLWAALHDRSILWACQRGHWPVQAWRRRLPDQSTMSRRLRDPRIVDDLRTLMNRVQPGPIDPMLMVDGKPLAVSEYSGDPDARNGWGAGRYARGYKLHVLIDAAQRLLAWELRPMNQAECVVAVDLLHQAARRGLLPAGATVRGDASYDSNPLHEIAGQLEVQLIAPRRKPHRSIGVSHRQHPGRLASIELTEHDAVAAAEHHRLRTKVERYLGTLATVVGGLFGLPSWARRLTRVQVWVGAKLALHAAYRPRSRDSPNAIAA